MNTSFCTHCGAKHTYNFAPPKFCSSCGESMSGEKKIAKASSRKKPSDDDDNDENSSDIDFVPEIDALSLHVEQEEVLFHSLGAILGQTRDAAKPMEKRFVDLTRKQNSRGN